MVKVRTFARIDQGIVMEIIPPVPLQSGWLEIMPENGDVRKLYGYTDDAWVEVTDIKPAPQPNWAYVDGVFAEPVPVEPLP